MIETIAAITESFVNLLYPLHCAVCKKPIFSSEGIPVCGQCKGLIRRNPRPYCRSCGRAVENSKSLCKECQKTKFHFDSSYSACLYDGVLKELIHLFKYNRKISLAGMLSELMIDFAGQADEVLKEIDIITFVPLGNARLKKRGFNQSGLLAFNLSKRFDLPLIDTLEKAAATRNQNELERKERLINVRGAFKARKGLDLKGSRVLLIDDVMTTGATLDECARILSEAGARAVRCFTLARGL